MDLSFPFSWHCDGTLVTTVLTEDCEVTATSTYHTEVVITSTSSLPLYTQDSGNILFALAVIIFFQFLVFVGYIFNRVFKEKKW